MDAPSCVRAGLPSESDGHERVSGPKISTCTNPVSQMCACCVKIGLDRRLTPSARCLNPAVRPKLPRELADCTPLHPLASHWVSQPKMGVSPGQTLNIRSLRGSLYIYINRRRKSSYIYIYIGDTQLSLYCSPLSYIYIWCAGNETGPPTSKLLSAPRLTWAFKRRAV